MSFFQRIAHHVVNEVMIKGLANSKTFQRFALRTDMNLQQMKKAGTENVSKTIDEITKQQQRSASTAAAAAAAKGANSRAPPVPPLRGPMGFVSAFVKEVQKDLSGPAGKSW